MPAGAAQAARRIARILWRLLLIAIKVGINGFGRIGRNCFRAAQEAGNRDADVLLGWRGVDEATARVPALHGRKEDAWQLDSD
jgi:hypothetical protein